MDTATSRCASDRGESGDVHALNPEIGYEAAAQLAKEPTNLARTVRKVANEQQVLSEKR